jgi:hypothetical protein
MKQELIDALNGSDNELSAYLEIRSDAEIKADILELTEYGKQNRTLRDEFAGKAMQGLLAHDGIERDAIGYVFPSDWRPLVSASFNIADAMLTQRSKAPSNE